ncbi:MAG: glycerate kinase type-2 family protein, partial [Acetobacteraceae bacterium]
MILDPPRLLRQLFDAAVAAADPRRVLGAHLPEKPAGRCIVVGGGKSAALMAAALEEAWPDVALEGTVVTRYGHGVGPLARIEVIEAAHPVPDANSERGARRLLERVRGLSARDLVLALISGGGSALLALGAPGITLADKQAVNRALLASGATIGEMNTVRKHLSAIKGGRLARAAAPAQVLTLAISDVPGDDPAVIASGPTVADPTSFADARAILARYAITPPASVAAHLAAAAEET